MNRRDFLKVSGMGAITLFLSGCGLFGLADDSKKSIMMATAYNSADWTMEALVNHYNTLVRYMEWQDVGQVMATGCGARSLVEKSEFADIAYKIGANL